MKARSDFVSNSSSCSFVLELSPNLALPDFVDKAAKGCLKHMGPNDGAFAARQDEANRAALNYHLRASELLYLGALKLGKTRYTVRKDEDPEYYEGLRQIVDEKTLCEGERVVRDEDGLIEMEQDVTTYEIAVRSGQMQYITGVDHWDGDWELAGKAEDAAKNIARYAAAHERASRDDWHVPYNSETYFISRATVWNTRALIAAGYEVVLEEWMDLDALEEKLKNGNRLVRVKVNNGGEGVDDDALFAFGGWDGEDALDGIDGAACLVNEVG